MHIGKNIFAQVMEYMPLHWFHQCVQKSFTS